MVFLVFGQIQIVEPYKGGLDIDQKKYSIWSTFWEEQCVEVWRNMVNLKRKYFFWVILSEFKIV